MPGLTQYFATPSASSRGVVAARLADGRYLVRSDSRELTAVNATDGDVNVGARVVLDRSATAPCIVAVVSLGDGPNVKEVVVRG
ncbi:hypothetical protein G3N56_06235 [Desulfovibrio sulfodismutans]|uniref:Uncharacterized protein n=1 Tax=Desulfolutivibrio sulfodismutans TaxID=63561 RepID=A0A7K3NJF6_9BACT|nr:hypothetical protein [Desulfolutivibrio sulfodismutans]NDY56341.1 hypothetical protein [Desulfolutivibrio sulfodismutans]QLA11529.1 hypothetical protein GD606_04175 [Desulfolutivibrio sulfodismutans DSM 3696]QLA14174.1 hypothetical protein GD606_18835 [Desulfolutivibrio sulfodismutans DSM 3696]